ncbi:hypothetical protein [Streptomyces sp. NPDC020965]|uniref:hypothetical protein n=1 Tax=Streptomyces sp. NPDC020965 TaxID=3365105 RepID=UPI00379B1ACE
MTHGHGDDIQKDELTQGSFAERLDYLCKHSPRGPVSNPQVAKMLAAEGLPSLSDTYMWQLRCGRADNPTKKHMDGLADFFAVPKDYWSNRTTATVVNSMITRLNGFKKDGATSEQLHRQLASFTKQMSEGVTPEALIEQLEELARLKSAGVTADTLKRLQDARVTDIAMRAVGLSDEGLTAAAAMIDQVRRLEGLPARPLSPDRSPGDT